MNKSAVDALLESADDIPAVAQTTEFKPPLPKTKGEVGKLATEQMDALVEAHGLAMPGEWAEGSAAEKHKMLNVALGFVTSKKTKKEKDAEPQPGDAFANGEAPNPANLAILEDDEPETKPAVASKGTVTSEPDPISQVTQAIEKLTDQVAVESEITTLLASEGMNDFKLGGLMLKLLEIGTFPDNSSFKSYITERWGIKYRKARYLIELYNGLVKSGVPWEAVAGIGWSKVITLLPVLTQENVGEWVEKAKQYNNDTLQAAVKAALAKDGSKNPQDAAFEDAKLKTLTFGVGPDQEELIKEALEHAMKVGQTEHKGVALELICTEYLGTTSGIAPGANTPKQAAPPKASFDELLEQAYKPQNVFNYFKEQAKGDIATALSLIFGDEFDAAFPGVEVNINITN